MSMASGREVMIPGRARGPAPVCCRNGSRVVPNYVLVPYYCNDVVA